MKKFFQENPDLFESVDVKVREAVGLLKPKTDAKTEKTDPKNKKQ